MPSPSGAVSRRSSVMDDTPATPTVSTTGLCPLTSTVSATVLTFMDASILAVKPVVRLTPSKAML